MFNKQKIYLIRLRNPWGEKEWNGAWSDGSEEWNKVSESQRKSLGITFEDDGEFWMPYEDFLRHFTNLVVCRMPNKTLLSLSRTWHESLFLTQWKYDANRIQNRAGGCINNKDTFLLNPQVESNRTTRAHKVGTKRLGSPFINSRSVFAKATLEKGRYIVVASTFDPQIESPIMMRIFSDNGAKCKQLDEDYPKITSFFCCTSTPRVATQLRVLSASNLEKQDRTGGGADPYLYVKCEGQAVRSITKQNNLNPEFNFSAIFYRKNTSKPIIIEASRAVQPPSHRRGRDRGNPSQGAECGRDQLRGSQGFISCGGQSWNLRRCW
ncbi:putative calpain-5 isoform X1 [Apostichopus japonicus]|uniref:Putative calpain-5 isoform X1 n=1 Tax=Stichopus japonicus TaxID=307972 RepID=A0A2G8KWN9_STIJA|nr:putative calpain-5 isoform X1 [Apostichopus japonicus]